MKTAKHFFLLIYISFSYYSCTSQEEEINIINFSKKKTVIIETDKGCRFFPFTYFEKDDSLYVLLNNDEKRELTSYNLLSRNIKETIPIPFFRFQNLFTVKYHSKDSIFLAFNPSSISRYDYHDSSVMMINNKGEIKKILNFNNTPVLCSYNVFNSSENSMSLPSAFTDVYYSNNKLFFSISKQYCKPGDSISESVKLPYAGHFDFEKNKMIIYNELNEFPFFKTGRYYHRLYRKALISLSNRNKLLIAFRHTPLIYEYDYLNKINTTHELKSSLVDTIKPDTIYIEKTQDIYNSQYTNLIYDKYRKQYYRFVTLAAKNEDIPYRKNHRKVSMLVADTNFNVIAEGIIPENLSPLSFMISKNGLWFVNTENKENITYELYRLEYSKGTKEDLIEKYNEKTEANNKFGLVPFMDNVFSKKIEDAAIVIVPSDLGCHSCASTISKFYVDNQNLFKGKKLYFVVAGLSEFSVNPFIKENNLEDGMPNLFIDNKGVYLNYFESFNNPKLFVLENGKVKFEKVYKPAELLELELKIKEYSEK